MITRLSTSIAYKLMKMADEKITYDQLEIYIYGLECFFNTSITILLLTIWGFFSHNLSYTLVWLMVFSLLRHLIGGFHAPTQFTCILGSFILGFMNKWAIIYINQTLFGYILLLCACILFAPTLNNKILLSPKQKYKYKALSLIIVSLGLVLFYKIGITKLTSTVFYSFCCAIILLILEQLKSIFQNNSQSLKDNEQLTQK